MRYRIKEYSASVSNNVVTLSFDVPDGMVISIDPEDGSLDPSDERFIEESVRLIIDETNKVVLCSSMQKDSIINIEAQGIQGESTADTIIIYIAIPQGKTVSASDKFTVEFDWGESIGDVAAVLDYMEQGGMPTIANIAKQGDNPNTSLSDIKTAVNTLTTYTNAIVSNGAKEATLGTSQDTSVSTTIFGWLKSIRDFLVGIVTTAPYAKETTAQQAATAAQALSPIASAAEAYNEGKPALATAITAKGVAAAASDSLSTMATKVSLIAQDPITWDDGVISNMYEKQMFGSLETPNYWNLYEILAYLLSDHYLRQDVGHVGERFGGFLLAEYYRGYPDIALSGAGTAGAYVVSDIDPQTGEFKAYYADTTHVWSTEFDGRGNRWVAYCFADEYHDYQITDTNTSPRSIFIGRKVGVISCLAASRISQIVVTESGELLDFTGSEGNFGKAFNIRLKNHQTGTLITNTNIETAYIKADKLSGGAIMNGNTPNLNTVIIDCPEITSSAGFITTYSCGIRTLILKDFRTGTAAISPYSNTSHPNFTALILTGTDSVILSGGVRSNTPTITYIYVGYNSNTKDDTVRFQQVQGNQWRVATDLEMQSGWCKNIIADLLIELSEANMYAHILQRLKQDEPLCGSGVTITLGSANLAKLTSAESVALLDSLTNTYGYTFA